jgi:hypothetical protein
MIGSTADASGGTELKDDAWVRLPRETWVLGMAYAEKSGRKLREIAAKALSEYIKREEKKAK